MPRDTARRQFTTLRYVNRRPPPPFDSPKPRRATTAWKFCFFWFGDFNWSNRPRIVAIILRFTRILARVLGRPLTSLRDMFRGFDSPMQAKQFAYLPAPVCKKRPKGAFCILVRVGRIELPSPGWKPGVLPLNYTRIFCCNDISIHPCIFRAKNTP